MLSSKVGPRVDKWCGAVFRFLTKLGITPNFLTLTGLLVNLFASVSFALGYFWIAGILMLSAGTFDILDGGVARTSGKGNPFGAFLDSIIDRYSDMLLLTGIIIYYARSNVLENLILSCMVTIGTVLVPYSRAKAERFIPKCDVGLMERAERILILAAGAIFNLMTISLGILAVLTHVTVVQRILFSWKEMNKVQ